jgi:hypothetical protein
MDASQLRLVHFTQLFSSFQIERPELPSRGMLILFAAHIELSDRYLSHIKCGRKQIGAATARRIESKCGKPHGWLDRNVRQNHSFRCGKDSAGRVAADVFVL